jgi:putative glutamine amidotransferase
MNCKPLIGLNADLRPARKDSPAFTYICAGYFDSVVRAGGIPLILPPVAETDDLERLLDLVDGMVLVGGADLDPRYAPWINAAKNSTAA